MFKKSVILLFSAAFVAVCPIVSAFTLQWGDAPGQLGLVNQPEMERNGPLTFAVSPAGTLFVADSVHNQVKEFAADGTYLRTFLPNAHPSQISFDSKGNVLMLDGHDVTAWNSKTAASVRAVHIPESVPLIEGYAQEVFDEEGMIGVNDPDQKVYLMDAQSDHLAMETSGRRAATPLGTCITMLKSPGTAVLETKEEVAVDGVSTKTSEFAPSAPGRRFGAVIYRGTAGPKNTRIVETEEIAPDGVHLILRETDEPTSGFTELPNNYFTTIYKKFQVMPDGTVWQMRTTPQGVEFTMQKLPL